MRKYYQVIFSILTGALFTTISGCVADNNDSLLKQIYQRALETESDTLLFWQDGKIIYYNDFQKPQGVKSVQSISKSVSALALAVLIEEGKIPSLEAPMSTWLPEWKDHPTKSKITLRMIMTHTSGLVDTDLWYEQADIITHSRALEPEFEPGTDFSYSGVATSLIDEVIRQTSGIDTDQFIAQKVFRPLGITDDWWLKDKKGHTFTAWGLYLSDKDLLILGQMMLNKGTLNNHRIISEAWFQQITTKSQSFKDCGLFWWLYKPHFFDPSSFDIFTASGWGGQYLVVYPEKKLIAIRIKDPDSIPDGDDDLLDRMSFKEFPKLIGSWQ